MRYLALTISINDEVPNFQQDGLMKKIIGDFLERDYYIRLVHDRSTRPRGFYLLETDDLGKQHSVNEFRKILDAYKKNGVRYELIELKDLSELSGR